MDLGSEFDTICAVATPIGEGGIGIIKISGPEALPLARRLFLPSRPGLGDMKSHRLYHGWIRDPSSDALIDEVLLGYMAAPRSYTREDVVEINCHGGYLAVERIMDLVLAEGARLAQAGEFTRRAFLNGRIDLSQAEAVIDTIHARSRESLAAASLHLRGYFKETIEELRERLLQIEAQTGAFIDFPDDAEEAAPAFESLQSLSASLDRSILAPIEELLRHYDDGRVLREGLAISLAGKPNVGKSSLLNALVGKDRAIVTPFPGTTRDVVEDSFLLSGILVRVLDTAGIRSEPDVIEALGIQRTIRSFEDADAVVCLIDGSRPLDGEDDLVFRSLGDRPKRLVIINKADLPAAVSPEEVRERYGCDAVPRLSALDPADIGRLRATLHDLFLKKPLQNSRSAIIPNLRQKECLAGARETLLRIREMLDTQQPIEFIGVELQSVRRRLDSLLGWSRDEDVLDRIFSRFCIGK